MIGRLQNSNQTIEVEKPTEAVRVLSKSMNFQLTDTEQEQIMQRLIRGDNGRTSPNKWGMANAVTNLANDDSVSYERAMQLQDIGGKVLAMPDGKWQTVATATKDTMSGRRSLSAA